jgi:uncharacterized membrane protein YgcG
MRTFSKLLTFICIGFIASCIGKRIESNSNTTSRIIDNSGILSQHQKDSIFTLIEKLEDEVGSQVGILTIDTLGNETLEEFSIRMARMLGFGRASHNDGLLITVVTMERKIRIEVGTGLENIVTDEIAGSIIRNDMAPSMREEKYGQGIYLAVERISRLIMEKKELVGTRPGN